MSWPLSQDYNEAIQNLAQTFADSDLRDGEAVTNALGIPVPRSGNFADVYQVRGPDGKEWAVKCFTRHITGLQERYAALDEHLNKANLPFSVPFRYLAEGVRIRGQWYPVLKMQWVQGNTLNEFVAKHRESKSALEAMLQMWAKLSKRLRDADVSHGDIQHGNVLLVPSTKSTALGLKLIDYDGMWVPALSKKPSGEVGHANYQHPQRARDTVYSQHMDRFPHLLIATSLRALKIIGPELWDRYDNGDNLLFKEGDLLNMAGSPLVKELWKHPDPGMRALIGQMILASEQPLAQAAWLDEIMPEGEPRPLLPGQEKMVKTLLGDAPVVSVPASPPSGSRPAAAPIKGTRSAPENVFAAITDSATVAGAKRRAGYKPKQSSMPLIIGGSVLGIGLLVLVGVIVMITKGRNETEPTVAVASSPVEPKEILPVEPKTNTDTPEPKGPPPVPPSPPPLPPPPVGPPPTSEAWRYGFGRFDDATQRVESFKLLEHFNGRRRAGGAIVPNRESSWAFLDAIGGQPGDNPGFQAIRRWISPVNGRLRIGGMLRRLARDGDGVRGLIVSNRQGLLGTWQTIDQEVATSVESVDVQIGETIDFVIDSRGGIYRDHTIWAPVIRLVDPAKNLVWDATRDFGGPLPEFKGPATTFLQQLPLGKSVVHVAFAGPENRLIVVTADGFVHVFDSTTFREQRKFQAHGEPIRAIAMGPANLVLTAGDKEFRVSDWSTGSLIRSVPLDNNSGAIRHILVTSDGNSALTCGTDQVVSRWDVKTLQRSGGVEPNGKWLALATAPAGDGKSIWLATGEGGIQLWDLTSEKAGPIIDPKWNSTGPWVTTALAADRARVAASSEGCIWVWDATGSKLLWQLGGSGSPIRALAFTPKSDRLISGSLDGWLRVWDLTAGQETHRAKVEPGIEAIAVSADGNLAAVCGDEGLVRIWSISDAVSPPVSPPAMPGSDALAELKRIPGDPKLNRRFVLLPDGKRGVLPGPMHLKILDLESGAEINRLTGISENPGALVYIPGNRLVSVSPDKVARIWNLATGTETARLDIDDKDKQVMKWAVATGKPLWTVDYPDPTDSVTDIAFVPDGKQFYISTAKADPWLGDSATGKLISKVKNSTMWAGLVVAMMPDGRLIAAHPDNAIRIWNIRTEVATQTLLGHDAEVRSLSLRSDGKRLLSADAKGMVILWNLETGKPTYQEMLPAPVHSVQFSADATLAAATCNKGPVIIWKLVGGSPAVAVKPPIPPMPPTPTPMPPTPTPTPMPPSGPEIVVFRRSKAPNLASIRRFALSADGKLGAMAGSSETVVVVQTDSNKTIATFTVPRNALRAVTFVPPDRPLTIHQDKVVRLWDIKQQKAVRTFDVPETFGFPATLRASHDGKNVVALDQEQKQILQWDVETGKVSWQKDMTPEGTLFDVAITNSGQVFLATETDPIILSLKTGAVIRRVTTATARAAIAVAISPDGRRFVTGHLNGKIKVFDAANDQMLRELKGHDTQVKTLVVGADNRRLLSGDEKGDVRLWDTETGDERGRAPAGVLAAQLEWPGSSTFAASGCDEGTIVVWKIENRALPSTAPAPPKPPAVAGRRRPIPAPDAVAAVEAKLKEQYKADYAKKLASDMRDLGKKLYLESLVAEGDPVLRYVLLREARDLGAQGVDPALVTDAIAKLCAAYDIDAASQIVAAFETLGKLAQTPITQRPIAEGALAAIKAVLAADDFDAALRLVKVAETVAKKSGPAHLSEAASATSKILAKYRSEFDSVKPYRDKLKTDPHDPKACQAVGSVIAFVRGDWQAGLEMLAKSEDPKWKAVATKEINPPTSTIDMMALADAWWDLGEGTTGDVKGHCQRRARYWYTQARQDVAGAEKVKVDDRLRLLFGTTAYKPGLVGEFTRIGETTRLHARVDNSIDFTWSGSPDPKVTTSMYAGRWNGYLLPPQAGVYKLILEADESASVQLDRRKILEVKKTGEAVRDRAPIRGETYVVVGDKPVSLRIEMNANYRNFSGRVSLRWEPLLGGAESVIGSSSLFHDRAQGDIIPK
jgi:WD40 repeat protein